MAKKLPKKIAGVKIPKKLRKRGGKFYAVISSPVVAHIVAAGLIAAADALAQKKSVKKASKKAKRAAVDATGAVGSHASNVIDLLAFAARESARAIRANAKG